MRGSDRGRGATTLLIQSSEDLSGAGSATGVISSPSGTAVLPFRVDATGGAEGMFAINIQIPPKAETGLLFVSNLALYDRASNPLINRFTAATVPPGGTIRVTPTESDSTPPEIVSITVERASVSGGKANRIRVDVHDDRSGVASVRGAFHSPSRPTLVPFACRATPDPAVWEGEIAVPAGTECSAWTLQNIRPADAVGNAVLLTETTPQTAEAGFTVAGRDCGR